MQRLVFLTSASLIVVVLASLLEGVHGAFFMSPSSQTTTTTITTRRRVNTAVAFAKKRRRRKTSSDDSSSSSDASFDDLPDFDLEIPKEEDAQASADTPTIPLPKSFDGGSSGKVITSAQMSKRQTSLSSVSDLLTDRELENAFVFDDQISMDDTGVDLPSFSDYVGGGAKQQPQQQQMSEKRAKQAERKAAAIAEAEAQEKEEGSFLSNLPFMSNNKDDQGEEDTPANLQFIKLLENGAWAGIYALVAWEIYLNSPLFERAAPLAPVVYSTPTP